MRAFFHTSTVVAAVVGSYQDLRESWARWLAMEEGKGVGVARLDVAMKGGWDRLDDGVELMERKRMARRMSSIAVRSVEERDGTTNDPHRVILTMMFSLV